MSLGDAVRLLILLGQSFVLGEAYFMNRLSVAEFHDSTITLLDKPLVIENALEWRDCQYWWKHILTRSGSEAVTVEECDGITGRSPRTSRTIPLHKAVQLAMSKSSHSTPIYISSQGRSCSTDQLPFYDLLESLFHLSEDYFPLFALHAPITDKLILAGEGASSRLQRHPYTNYCLGLAGNSLWRLLPPEQEFQRSEPIHLKAWEEFQFSIGDQLSQGGMFELRHKDVEPTDDSDEIAFMDNEKFMYYQHLAQHEHLLRPSLAVSDEWMSTVLLDGDLLVVPPNWWYQSYNMEMSISLESQRCHDLSKVVGHIVENSNLSVPPRLLQRTEFHSIEDAKQLIDELFELLQQEAQSKQPRGDSML